ncbi:helix-turn-helix transcriptional regulator [Sulfurovum riftiae]|nr:WYL domain-containing transcriptional regulator [Sulfurovum riftiae]
MPKLFQHQRHNIILERLENGETLSITALAREWETTPKTVSRDFRKLMEGNHGIIRASDGKQFTMAQSRNRSLQSNTAIKILDSLSADIGGKFYTKAQAALHKLQQHIDSPFYTRIDVEDISNHLDVIDKLEDAISNQQMINFTYKPLSSDTTKTYTKIAPYKIIIFHGFFYLFAEMKSSQYTYYPKFYLKEIKDIKILETTFVRDEKILDRIEKALGFWFDPLAKPFEVTLLLNAEVTIYFERKPIKGQYLKKNADGTAELTIMITHKNELFSILKQWLPQVRVIEPYVLQEEFDEMMRKYIKWSN